MGSPFIESNRVDESLQAVAFDMDGVLVASEREWERVYCGVLAEYGLELSDADRRALYGCSDIRENEILSRAANVSLKEIAKRKNDYYAQHPIDYRSILIPGARELVIRCHELGLKVALATSSLSGEVSRMLSETQMHDLFDAVITGDYVKKPKPDPAVYELAAATVGIDPKYMIAIDDSLYGFRSASLAGMKVIQFANSGQESFPGKISVMCTNFREVAYVIESMVGIA